jgi:tetratricopeptide (TPR) repeat protein
VTQRSFCFIALLPALTVAQQPRAIQQEGRDCVVNSVNNQGHINLTCPTGTDPKFVEKLQRLIEAQLRQHKADMDSAHAQLKAKDTQIAAQHEELRKAQDALKQAQTQAAELQATLRLLATSLKQSGPTFQQIEQAVQKGDFETASDIFDEVLKNETVTEAEHAKHLFARGLLRLLQLNPLLAADDLKKAYETDNTNTYYALLYAETLMKVHDYSVAAPVLERIVKMIEAVPLSKSAADEEAELLAIEFGTIFPLPGSTKAVPYSTIRRILKAMALSDAGIIYDTQGRTNEALARFSESRASIEPLAKNNPVVRPALAATYNNLGSLYLDNGDPQAAMDLFQKAAAIYEDLAKTSQTNQADVAMAYNNTGNALRHLDRHKEAIQKYQQAYKIYDLLAQTSPLYEPDRARTITNIGAVALDQRDWPTAEKMFRQAHELRVALAEADPDEFLPDLARSFDHLGDLYRAQNKIDEAKTEYEEALARWRRIAEKQALPYLANFAHDARILGAIYDFIDTPTGYEQARSYYTDARDALATLVSMSHDYSPLLAAVTLDLANVLVTLQRYPDANQSYMSAMAVYRDLAQNPTNGNVDYTVSLAETYDAYAALRSRTGDVATAALYYNKAQEALNGRPDGPARNHALAWLLANIAGFELNHGKPEFAKKNAQDARSLAKQLWDHAKSDDNAEVLAKATFVYAMVLKELGAPSTEYCQYVKEALTVAKRSEYTAAMRQQQESCAASRPPQ